MNDMMDLLTSMLYAEWRAFQEGVPDRFYPMLRDARAMKERDDTEELAQEMRVLLNWMLSDETIPEEDGEV